MTSVTDGAIQSALLNFFEYRRRQGIGGLSNFFPIYLLEHLVDYEELLDGLEDDVSRDLVLWFIQFRLVNALVLDKSITKTIVDPLLCQQHQADLFARAKTHAASNLEESLDVDIIENWLLEGYRLPGICEPEAGDVVLDVGAFNGNSSLYFAEKIGATGSVFAIEPDPSTYKALKRNVKSFQGGKYRSTITPLNMALSDSDGELRFSRSGAASRVDPNGDVVVKSRTLDSIVAELALEKLDLLKFDIEGYEKQAMAGAVNTIKRFRPKLMICIYHLHMDMVEIPRLVKKISPWYRFYVRHHAAHDGELVLYCTPKHHHQSADLE
jgi:FkbM family methyltransferase